MNTNFSHLVSRYMDDPTALSIASAIGGSQGVNVKISKSLLVEKRISVQTEAHHHSFYSVIYFDILSYYIVFIVSFYCIFFGF